MLVNRHRRIMNLYDKTPKVGSNTFIAPNASVIGDVEVGDNTSIWYGTVLRGTFPHGFPLNLLVCFLAL
jgi:gamma-carbonic anhydrase